MEKLVYNIFTRNAFPRAVTIDVQKKSIMYVNDVFWKWEDELIKKESKKTRAIEIYDLLKWLIEEEEFQLSQGYDADRWRELSEKFEK